MPRSAPCLPLPPPLSGGFFQRAGAAAPRMVLFGLWLEGGGERGGGRGRGHGWRVLGRYFAACNALALDRGYASGETIDTLSLLSCPCQSVAHDTFVVIYAVLSERETSCSYLCL